MSEGKVVLKLTSSTTSKYPTSSKMEGKTSTPTTSNKPKMKSHIDNDQMEHNPTFGTPAKGSTMIEDQNSKLNIILTPVTGPQREADKIFLGTTLKRKAPGSPEESLAPKGLRTGSSPPKLGVDCRDISPLGQLPILHVIEEDCEEIIIAKDCGLSVEKSEVEETQEKSSEVKEDDSEKELGVQAIMSAIQAAVNKAVEPLSLQISELIPLKEHVIRLEQEVVKLTLQMSKTSKPTNNFSCQGIDSTHSSNSWGLKGQGQKQAGATYKPNLVVTTADLVDLDIYQPASYAHVTKKTAPKNIEQAKNKTQNLTLTTPQPNNPAFNLARRCQGFHPIGSEDIGRNAAYYKNIKDDEERFQEAGKDCVRDFLKNEMGMSTEVVGDLRILSVFFPPVGPGKFTLFAEFHNEEEVQLIRSFAKNLNITGEYKPMLVLYVPRSLQQRFAAVESAAYKIRAESNKKVMTRIWIGSDFELRKKSKGDATNWAAIIPIDLPNLPAQAPKRNPQKLDVIDKRTPNTPLPTDSEVFSNISTYNSFDLLGADSPN